MAQLSFNVKLAMFYACGNIFAFLGAQKKAKSESDLEVRAQTWEWLHVWVVPVLDKIKMENLWYLQ